jgi:hypothetical protein
MNLDEAHRRLSLTEDSQHCATNCAELQTCRRATDYEVLPAHEALAASRVS